MSVAAEKSKFDVIVQAFKTAFWIGAFVYTFAGGHSFQDLAVAVVTSLVAELAARRLAPKLQARFLRRHVAALAEIEIETQFAWEDLRQRAMRRGLTPYEADKLVQEQIERVDRASSKS